MSPLLTPDKLIAMRVNLKFANQTEMAESIGLKLRAYQDLELGNSPIRKMHVLALERVALARAVHYSDPGMMPGALLDDVIHGAKLFEAQPSRTTAKMKEWRETRD